MRTRKIWLFTRPIDLIILLVPIWAVWIFCFALPQTQLERSLPLWMWVLFIVGIDVSHVWSTLFRTYLDRGEFARHRELLWRTPFVVAAVFFALAAWSTLWFWRVLAYIALFHFVKQQSGFLALYRSRFGFPLPPKTFGDNTVVYVATLYPVIYWHLTDARAFAWFVHGDFFNLGATVIPIWLLTASNGLYWAVIIAWFIEEMLICRRNGLELPAGKILWMLTTAANWYLGIVYFNSDIAFSLTNVVAHGVPYIALICYYVEKKRSIEPEEPRYSAAQLISHVVAMLAVIVLLAVGEEYLWDMFVYRERGSLFETFFTYPLQALETPLGQALALALLSVPQVTHYIVDGFIWKRSDRNPYVGRIFA